MFVQLFESGSKHFSRIRATRISLAISWLPSEHLWAHNIPRRNEGFPCLHKLSAQVSVGDRLKQIFLLHGFSCALLATRRCGCWSLARVQKCLVNGRGEEKRSWLVGKETKPCSALIVSWSHKLLDAGRKTGMFTLSLPGNCQPLSKTGVLDWMGLWCDPVPLFLSPLQSDFSSKAFPKHPWRAWSL